MRRDSVVVLPSTATRRQILGVVRSWVALLAEERYADALRMFRRRSHWSAALMKTVIQNYGSAHPRSDGKRFKVTTSAGAPGRRPHHHVRRDLAEVWFDLPLNGAWSDLTATFDIVRHRRGLTLRLDDIHVM